MNANTTFLSTTRNGLSRAAKTKDDWVVEHLLPGIQINDLQIDPHKTGRVYAGTQANGVLVSDDTGVTWTGLGLTEVPVKSLAVCPHQPGMLYAGAKPVSLYVSEDSGNNWEEYPALRKRRALWWFSPAEPPDWRPYVQALAVSPRDPNILMAGVELGGVLRSTDRGRTWSRHRRGAIRDCHSLIFHTTNGNWVYEGGGSGMAFSRDGGVTWSKPKNGLGTKYGWMVAADPAKPEVYYLSASDMPSLLRGEWEPPAHQDGDARTHIYRAVDGSPWEKLKGGLPQPLDYMAYALITDPANPGYLYAGLANGEVWHTTNYGDTWAKLPVNLGSINRTMIMI